MAIDPFRTLGLQPGATAAEVKRAYRRLAKANHPDSAGPAALPRFLAIQEAYEVLTHGPKAGRGSRAGAGARGAGGGAGASGGAAAGEPWRADPARARAARERARARSGGGASTTGATGGGAAAPRGGGSPGPESRSGATGSAGGPAGPRSGSARRRAPRKATMGSTSYDEARDPTDTSWAGAAWYGPTSGEYWHVNPREYADPRKHGPQYQSRGRRASTTSGEAWDAEPADAGRREAFTHEDRQGSERAWSPPPRQHDARAAADREASEPNEPSDGPTFAESLAALGRRLDREPNDPVRRLGYALVAWAPVGLAVAAIVGGATGCTTYSATCTGAAPMIPWLLQAAILGLLLLLPRLARILATGTAAVVLALAPLTGLLLAIGGSGEPSAPAVLQVLLAIVWVCGVGLGIYAAARLRQAPSPSP